MNFCKYIFHSSKTELSIDLLRSVLDNTVGLQIFDVLIHFVGSTGGVLRGKMGRLQQVNWVSVDHWKTVDLELINQHSLFRGG